MCSGRDFGISQSKILIFLRKNIFGASKLFSEYFMMILIRFSNRLREGNRGNARGRLKNFKIFKIPHFASRGGFGADFGRILEISKTKTKISRSRIFDSGAHILFLSSSNMIVIDKPWGKSAQYPCEKIQTLKVPRKSQNPLDFLI